MSTRRIPYTEDDLRGLKKAEIASLITAQPEGWPKGIRKFGQSTSKKQMLEVLLNSENGFTKAVPDAGPDLIDSNVGMPEDDDGLTSLSSQTPGLSPDSPPVSSLPPEPVIQPQPQTGGDANSEPPTMRTEPASVKEVQRGAPSSSQMATTELAQIYLLVEDRRFNPVNKIALPIKVVPTYDFGDMYIASEAVVSAIQNAGILGSGTVRLSCPFRLDQSYDEPFAVGVGAQDGLTILQHQDQLYVPDRSTLSVHVQHHIVEASRNSNIEDLSGSPSASATNYSEPIIPASSSPPTSPAHPRRRSTKPDTVAWLKEKLKQCENYELFTGSSGRPVQNRTVAQVWRFVADFYALYFNAKSGVSGCRVSKKAIAQAMEVGETWLSESLTGDRLVRIYGPNGPNMNSEVVEELNAVRDPPRGKKALLEFLQTWEKDHPCLK